MEEIEKKFEEQKQFLDIILSELNVKMIDIGIRTLDDKIVVYVKETRKFQIYVPE